MTPPPDDLAGSGPGGTDAGERYERVDRIATGGMGEVWRARDTVLGREVAVKILKREYAEDPTFRARFEAEARHAAGLHHPGIASVFDYGLLNDDQSPYLVMELVDGKPLSDLIADGRPFDPEQARLLALQVAEALGAAHAAGVIHRDVKPGNLLVTPDGRVKITDFGIARATGSVAFTQTGQIVGTPQYLSPEQARGNPATAASDVYALGIVLFECLAGHRPFVADTPIATALAQIQQDVPPLPDTVPPALAAIVTRALAKDPAERFADGTVLADALRGAADGVVPPTVAVPVQPPADGTRVLPAAAAVGGAAALAGAAGVAPPTPPSSETAWSRPVDETPPAEEKRSRWPLYAVALLGALLLVALLIAHPWTGNGTDSPAKTDDTVTVDKAKYLGKPVKAVVAALHEQGLTTTVRTKDNPGGKPAATVADLSPTGEVKKGARVTIDAWGQPPAQAPSQDNPQDQPTKAEPSPTEPTQPGASQDSGSSGSSGNSGGGNSGQSKAPKPKSDKPVKPVAPGSSTNADSTTKGN